MYKTRNILLNSETYQIMYVIKIYFCKYKSTFLQEFGVHNITIAFSQI